jgi:AraC-like DNA-binding protein
MTAGAFASAGLVLLVFDGLRRQGIAPPRPPLRPGLRHAGPPVVAHGRKRELLMGILRQHGPVAILRVGEAVADQGFHPMLQALLRARGPADLIARWMRLERYAHSHHRTVVDRLDESSASLRHVSTNGVPPSAAEDLLVFGVHLGLLRTIGCRGVSAGIAGACVAWADGSWDDEAVERAVATDDTATWRLAWTGWQAPGSGKPEAASVCPLGAPSMTFDGCAEAGRLAAILAEDPARHVSLPDAAVALGLSPRALQRRLAAHGLTATAVGRAVQMREACALLAGGDDPLPAIGYACGFSDQAHFTRAFRSRVNMTPGAYRALLRPRGGGDAD